MAGRLTNSSAAPDTGSIAKKQASCTWCKAHKVKCMWDGSACQVCKAKGVECTMTSKPPSQGTMQCTTHGQSLPPGTRSSPNFTINHQPTQATAEELDQAVETTISTTGRKCSYSETNNFWSATGTGCAGCQHTQVCKDDSDPTVTLSGRTSLVTAVKVAFISSCFHSMSLTQVT